MSSFYTFNYELVMYSSWDMVRNNWMNRRINERTDWQKKWYIKVDAHLKKQLMQVS